MNAKIDPPILDEAEFADRDPIKEKVQQTNHEN